MPVAEHLIATTRGGQRCLIEYEHAAWLWAHVRLAFGTALSFVLMPDHLHLVAALGMRAVLIRVLAGFTRRTGIRFDVLPARPANSLAIAGRTMRYGFFNPVRGRLVEDPWCWPWSTLRDLGGAAYPCWTALDRIASVLGHPEPLVLRTLTTTTNHRVAPLKLDPVGFATVDTVRLAVASALRIPVVAIDARPSARQLVIQACDVVAGPTARRLAAELGCGVRTIFRARAPAHPALPAVLRCLADERLRIDASCLADERLPQWRPVASP